jgi:aminomethyltransferase
MLADAADYSEWKTGRRATALVYSTSTFAQKSGVAFGGAITMWILAGFGYQANVIQNAKAYAKALKDCGLKVSGNPEVGYTQTHQVLLDVGWTKGPEIARKLEENNIIVNYQAAPEEEGFTASGSLRMGVSEMTRFGMGPEDFGELAELVSDVVLNDATVKPRVAEFRKRFTQLGYCFNEVELEERAGELHTLF